MKESRLIRNRIFYYGIIQGVGFRPAVYRCAAGLDLKGFVQNRRSEVVAEIEGPQDTVTEYYEKFKAELPKAARIDKMKVIEISPLNEKTFSIIQSSSSDFLFPPIPPDLGICETCSNELFDPDNRRYLYPFITCTQCGPRYSIVEDTPFDRETTSMIDFPQCPGCLTEYKDPFDRRFHSQTNSCEICGPELYLTDAEGKNQDGDPLLSAIKLLSEGKIVAIQGIGGFHLAADPLNRETSINLVRDKRRENKPFALMVKDPEEVKNLCRCDESVLSTLSGPSNPIIILPVQDNNPDYLSLVSNTGTLGVMLPYTPLHLLLFFHPKADISYRHLIMTSGNLKGEPIITDPGAARRKLKGIADYFLFNNRRIIFRTDDSVLRQDLFGTIQIRRSRGFVPGLINTSENFIPSLALGGDLKNAPAFAKGGDIYLSPYIGDIENPETLDAFEMQIKKIIKLYDIEPERLLFDLHPGYETAKWGEKQIFKNKTRVQHHHAHILSVMAEYGLENVLGLSFDGTGYGTDGTIWGGEFLSCSRSSFSRLGSFKNFRLPGGDVSVLNPIRTAFSLLYSEYGNVERFFPELNNKDLLLNIIDKEINSPVTSSLGRIFDAASALLGYVDKVSYEGEGPIKMEGAALKIYNGQSGDSGLVNELIQLQVSDQNDNTMFFFNSAPLLYYLVQNRQLEDNAALSLLFHQCIAKASMLGAERMRDSTGLSDIALSGGVFQNVLLRDLLIRDLKTAGFRVFTNKNIPSGDGGLAVGQIYYL